MPLSQRLTTPRVELNKGRASAWSERLTLAGRNRALIAIALALSATAVVVATWQGVGLSPDALQYLYASESVGSGRGLLTVAWDGTQIRFTHYPPGYPLLLAGMAKLGFAAQDVARFGNILLFMVTLLLAGAISSRIAPRPYWTAALTVLACATAHDLIVVHSMAWSEPLYLTLTLGSVLALAVAIERRSVPFLVHAGALAAAASLARYVGAANIGLVALAVLLWWPTSVRKRLGMAFVAGALMIVPLAITLLAGADASEGAVGNRRMAWHPIDFTDLRYAASVVVKWVTPLDDATPLTAVWFVVFVTLILVILRRRDMRSSAGQAQDVGGTLVRLLGLFVGMYLAVLVASMSFVDAQTVFEPRFLVPLQLVAFILGGAWLARAVGRSAGMVRHAAVAAIAIVVVANVLRWVPWLLEARAHGLGLRRAEIESAAIVEGVRRLPADSRIYSNDPYYLRVQTGRPIAGLPRTRDPNSLLPNPAHRAQVQGICTSATLRPTFLVLLDTPLSGDSAAQAPLALQAATGERLTGGSIMRVAPGCTS